MDNLTLANLRNLLSDREPPCVTVYLPTHPAGPEGQQDRVRLKNLLNRAEDELTAGWMRAVEARNLLQPARDLPADPAYWNARSRGLAVFLAPRTFESYRLPLAVEDSVSVAERFTLRPLLPLLGGNDRFLILALSQNNVQLFEANRFEIKKVEIPDLPTAMKEALDYIPVDRGAQIHSAMREHHGKQSAVFHGQGGKSEAHKEDLHQFFRVVDAALKPHLRGETVPLLLAGVEYLPPIYQEITTYTYVCPTPIYCNCDYLTEQELHERALPVVDPVLRQIRDSTAQRVRDCLNTQRASDDLERILPAACGGRVATLFVLDAAHVWGEFSAETGRIEQHEKRQPGDRDLLEAAAIETLTHGGTVYAVQKPEMPSDKNAAALFRY